MLSNIYISYIEQFYAVIKAHTTLEYKIGLTNYIMLHYFHVEMTQDRIFCSENVKDKFIAKFSCSDSTIDITATKQLTDIRLIKCNRNGRCFGE